MSEVWTQKRQRACVRGKDGRFVRWKGGRTKSQLKKKENTFHGIAVHIGREFIRQRGRTARVGETVRTKTKSGSYHKQAMWYVRTPHGWRRTGSTRRPTVAQIEALCKRARRGQK